MPKQKKPTDSKKKTVKKLKSKPAKETLKLNKKPLDEKKKKPVKKTFNVSTVLKDLENQDKEFKKEQEASEVKQEEVFTEKVGPTMTISEID